MGLNPALVVFLVILGSAFVCAMGYAVHIRFGTKDEDRKRLNPLIEQEEYMRQVRQRNFNWMRNYCRDHGIRRPPPVRGPLFASHYAVYDWVSKRNMALGM